MIEPSSTPGTGGEHLPLTTSPNSSPDDAPLPKRTRSTIAKVGLALAIIAAIAGMLAVLVMIGFVIVFYLAMRDFANK